MYLLVDCILIEFLTRRSKQCSYAFYYMCNMPTHEPFSRPTIFANCKQTIKQPTLYVKSEKFPVICLVLLIRFNI